MNNLKLEEKNLNKLSNIEKYDCLKLYYSSVQCLNDYIEDKPEIYCEESIEKLGECLYLGIKNDKDKEKIQ